MIHNGARNSPFVYRRGGVYPRPPVPAPALAPMIRKGAISSLHH